MHEWSLVDALLRQADQAARAHGAVAVQRLTVKIGELAAVERELLKTAFDTFRQGTLCANAELLIDAVEARWECTGCGAAVPGGQVLRCGACGRPARLAAGDEIVLEQLELEVPDV